MLGRDLTTSQIKAIILYTCSLTKP